jgi:DNA-binding CsgD family transcriptional regulator
MNIEEFIRDSNRAETVDGLFELYKKAMADIGFDRLIFSLMTNHPHINRSAGHGIMLNYPEYWMKYYVEKNYESYDPVRRQMFVSSSSFMWKKVTELPVLTQTQVTLMNEAAEAKLYDGIGVPLRGPQGALAGVGAASSDGVGLDKNIMSYVNLISQQFYTAYLALEEQAAVADGGEKKEAEFVFLSDREQEILKWCARGKTKWEIGQILNISQHTIDYHIRGAAKKLQTNNITLSVLKALHMGLIQL